MNPPTDQLLKQFDERRRKRRGVPAAPVAVPSDGPEEFQSATLIPPSARTPAAPPVAPPPPAPAPEPAPAPTYDPDAPGASWLRTIEEQSRLTPGEMAAAAEQPPGSTYRRLPGGNLQFQPPKPQADTAEGFLKQQVPYREMPYAEALALSGRDAPGERELPYSDSPLVSGHAKIERDKQAAARAQAVVTEADQDEARGKSGFFPYGAPNSGTADVLAAAPAAALGALDAQYELNQRLRGVPKEERSTLFGTTRSMPGANLGRFPIEVPLALGDRLLDQGADVAEAIKETPQQVVNALTGKPVQYSQTAERGLENLQGVADIVSRVFEGPSKKPEAELQLEREAAKARVLAGQDAEVDPEYSTWENVKAGASRFMQDINDLATMPATLPLAALGFAASDLPPEEKARVVQQVAGGIVAETGRSMQLALTGNAGAAMREYGIPDVALNALSAAGAVRAGLAKVERVTSALRMPEPGSLTGPLKTKLADLESDAAKMLPEGQQGLEGTVPSMMGVERRIEKLRVSGLADKDARIADAEAELAGLGSVEEVPSVSRSGLLAERAAGARSAEHTARQNEIAAQRAFDAASKSLTDSQRASLDMGVFSPGENPVLQQAADAWMKARDELDAAKEARREAQTTRQIKERVKSEFDARYAGQVQRTLDDIDATKKALRPAQRQELMAQALRSIPKWWVSGGVLAATDAAALGLQTLKQSKGKPGVALRYLIDNWNERVTPKMQAIFREAQGYTSKQAAVWENIRANMKPEDAEKVLASMRAAEGVGFAGYERQAMESAWFPGEGGGAPVYRQTEHGAKVQAERLQRAQLLEQAAETGVDVQKLTGRELFYKSSQQVTADALRALDEAKRQTAAARASSPRIAALEQSIAATDRAIAELRAKAQAPSQRQRPLDFTADARERAEAARLEARAKALEYRREGLARRLAQAEKELPTHPSIAEFEKAVAEAKAAEQRARADYERVQVGDIPAETRDAYRAEAAELRNKVREQEHMTSWLNEHPWVRQFVDAHFEMTELAQRQGRLPQYEATRPFIPQPIEFDRRRMGRKSGGVGGVTDRALGAMRDASRTFFSGTRRDAIPQSARVDQFGHTTDHAEIFRAVIDEARQASLFQVYEEIAKLPTTLDEAGMQARRLAERGIRGNNAEPNYAQRETARARQSGVAPNPLGKLDIDSEYVRVPDDVDVIPMADNTEHRVPKFGALAGKYIPADDYVTLVNMVELPRQLTSALNRINSLTKGAKTILDVGSMARNMYQGLLIQLPMAGVSLMNPRNWESFYQAVRDVAGKKPSPAYAEALAAGLDEGAGVRSELAAEYLAGRFLGGVKGIFLHPLKSAFDAAGDALEYGKRRLTPRGRAEARVEKRLREEVLNPLAEQGRWSEYERIRAKEPRVATAEEAGTKARKSAWKAIKAAAWEFPGQVYGLMDQVVRGTILHDRLSKGMPMAEAVADAKKWSVDYGNINGLIQMLRAPVVPILYPGMKVTPGRMATAGAGFLAYGMPFITFAAKSAPLFAEWAAANPARRILELGALEQISLANMRIAAPDVGATAEQQQAAGQAEGMIPVSALYPDIGRRKDDSLRYLRLDPFTPFSSFEGERLRGVREKTPLDYLSPFLGQSMITGALLALAGHDKRADKTIPPEDRIAKAAEQLLPTLTPGVGTGWRQLQGNADRFGRVQDPGEVIGKALLGVTVKSLHPTQSLVSDLYELKDVFDLADREATRALGGDRTSRAIITDRVKAGDPKAAEQLTAMNRAYYDVVHPALTRFYRKLGTMPDSTYKRDLLTHLRGPVTANVTGEIDLLLFREAVEKLHRRALDRAVEETSRLLR